MPFDQKGFDITRSKTMTMLETYKELLRIIDEGTHGDQGSYRTCLWSEVRWHRPFLNAGLYPDPHRTAPSYIDRAFFGNTRLSRSRLRTFFLGRLDLFGSSSLKEKREGVLKRIAELEKTETTHAV